MSTSSADSAHSLTDFSDKLSPMLVKELRQGLRTNLFVTAFILLQGFMILCILMGTAGGSTNSDSSSFFWFFIVVTFIVLQPLRGVSALSAEYSLNTMDLLQLTRLDALRIVVGKWCALNAQTLLLLTAVIPYVVLRYFFGSVNIVSDLTILGLCALSSAVLSAVTIGCSAHNNIVLRCALLIAGGLGFAMAMSLFLRVSRYGGGGRGGSFIQTGEILLMGLAFVLAIPFFLLLGASRIAPNADDYSLAKRLLGVLGAVVAMMFTLIGVAYEFCFVFASVILFTMLVDALTEPLPIHEAVLQRYKSFLKRGFAYLLSPGWHTGLLLLVVSVVIWVFAARYHSEIDLYDIESLIAIISAIGTLVFPLLVIHFFFNKSTQSQFGLYLIIQVCILIISGLALATAESLDVGETLYLLLPLPMVTFVGGFNESLNQEHLVVVSIVSAISLLVPLCKGLKHYREMGRVFGQLRDQ